MKRYGMRKLLHNDEFFDLDSIFSRDTFAVDIKDEKDKYIVEAELAGYTKEEVGASLVDHWLEIVATKNKEINENDKYLDMLQSMNDYADDLHLRIETLENQSQIIKDLRSSR